MGGKAINLGRMTNAGFPVPEGFAISTVVYHRFNKDKTIPKEIQIEIVEAYKALGGGLVAVRSSATAEDLKETSMAGQYETFLNIEGEDQVLEAVTNCLKSIELERIKTYLLNANIKKSEVAIAVVVQRLVTADVAGVMFTANPGTGSTDEMLIEASWGLGEAVVSGSVQPDLLTLEAETGQVKEAKIAKKELWLPVGKQEMEPVPAEKTKIPCLNSENVDKLWQLGKAVSAHYGKSQDIEWAIYNDQLYLLQSRAITTFNKVEEQTALMQSLQEELKDEIAQGNGGWVSHNLSETLAHPTPLTWSFIRYFMSGKGGYGEMYKTVGFEPSEKVSEKGFLKLIGGRVYMDISLSPDMFFENYPFDYDLELLRTDPDAANNPPTLPKGSFGERIKNVKKLSLINQKMRELAACFDKQLDEKHIPDFKAWVNAEKGNNYKTLSNEELIHLLRETEQKVLQQFAPLSLLPGLIVGMLLEDFRAFLNDCCYEEDCENLILTFSAGLEKNKTIEANIGLFDMSQGNLSIDKWMEEFGHRGPDEFDLSSKRWREQPDEVQGMANRLKDGINPAELHQNKVAQISSEITRLTHKLSDKNSKKFNDIISSLNSYIRFREDGKYYLMMGYELMRQICLEIGERLKIDDDLFFLTLEELLHSVETGYVSLNLIEKRKYKYDLEKTIKLPQLITGDTIDSLFQKEESPIQSEGNALSISQGLASGKAKILHSPTEKKDIGAGYILVCHSTDPSWTPLFINANGLILEKGGMLSHGAIVAREMNIPAIVVPDAMSIIEEDTFITVDGNNGSFKETKESDTIEVNETPAEEKLILPPPVGKFERSSNRWRNISLLVWLAFFAVVFGIPSLGLYDLSIQTLDKLLWPLTISLGKPVIVAIVATIFAFLSIVGQRYLTDNSRLAFAKKCAGKIEKKLRNKSDASDEEKATLKQAGKVQYRIMGASFVPMALILGPMVMSFMWLMDRIDPMSANPTPGATANITITVDGEYTDSIHLIIDDNLNRADFSSPVQAILPIRSTLEGLYEEWKTPSTLDNEAWEIKAAAKAARQELLSDLGHYLNQQMESQQLTWTVLTPDDQDGRYKIEIVPENGDRVIAHLVLGHEYPPEPKEIAIPENSPIISAELLYNDQRTKESLTFWTPLQFIGIAWDLGWLGIYLLIYIPFMFLLKFIFKIP
ncbi:PEP/pyruvate-binding domain-containing protein [Bacteroidota bacterium]